MNGRHVADARQDAKVLAQLVEVHHRQQARVVQQCVVTVRLEWQ
jgi:hypothetical protein